MSQQFYTLRKKYTKLCHSLRWYPQTNTFPSFTRYPLFRRMYEMYF